MTFRLGLWAYKTTITDVEKQVGELTDLAGKIDVTVSNDLSTLAGYSSESVAKIGLLTGKLNALHDAVAEGRKRLEICTAQNQAMESAVRSAHDPEDMSPSIESQEDSTAQRASNCILADPNIPATILRQWGPAWWRKIDEALNRLNQPSQLPTDLVIELQASLERAQDDNRQAQSENNDLTQDLERARAALADVRAELEAASDTTRSLKNQCETIQADNDRLQYELASASKSLAESNAHFVAEKERTSCQLSPLSSSVCLLRETLDIDWASDRDWESVLKCVEALPSSLPAKPQSNAWSCLEPWSNGMDEPCRVHTMGADQALIRLILTVQGHDASDIGLETLATMQCALSSLQSTSRIQEGLCRMLRDTIYGQAVDKVYIALALCQILDTVAKRWSTAAAEADALGFLHQQKTTLSAEDVTIVAAILKACEDDDWASVPLCVPATVNDHSCNVVVVKSVDMFLLVDRANRSIRWIGSDRADWDTLDIRGMTLRSPSGSGDVHLKLVEHVDAIMAIVEIKCRVAPGPDNYFDDDAMDETWEG